MDKNKKKGKKGHHWGERGTLHPDVEVRDEKIWQQKKK